MDNSQDHGDPSNRAMVEIQRPKPPPRSPEDDIVSAGECPKNRQAANCHDPHSVCDVALDLVRFRVEAAQLVSGRYMNAVIFWNVLETFVVCVIVRSAEKNDQDAVKDNHNCLYPG